MIETYPDVFWFILATLFLPLVSSLISFAIPKRYSWIVPPFASFFLLLTAIASFFLFFHTWWPKPTMTFEAATWFKVGSHALTIQFETGVPSLMVLAVSTVSFLVHLYSIGYMAGEDGLSRYFGFLGLFSFSMIGLVLSSNLMVTFVFWELMGVCSYFLIGYWHEKPTASAAATKAFLMNRFGDVAFLTGIVLLWAFSGSLVQSELYKVIPKIPAPIQLLIGACIGFGVLSKSAQFPLSSWLPDAMEGPTPVSALIHAATMVAAGVYVITIFRFVFPESVLFAITMLGAITAVAGALGALLQFDIKKILAYSTISQLGLMVMCVGPGNPAGVFLHLIDHAFFKACLFLSAGAVIHILTQASRQANQNINIQDIRNLGGLAKKMPLVATTFIISACSLAGLPLFSGFISKEMMFGSLFENSSTFLILALIISFLTTAYSFRLVWYLFFSKTRTISQFNNIGYPAAPWVMKIPLLLLAVASTWVFFTLDYENFVHYVLFDIFRDWKYLITSGVITSSLLFSYFYYRSRTSPVENKKLNFLTNNFGLDTLYKKGIVAPVLVVSSAASYVDDKWIDKLLHAGAYAQVTIAHLAGWFDKYIVDGAVNGSGKLSKSIGERARSIINGKIQSYILWAATGLIIFIAWILFD